MTKKLVSLLVAALMVLTLLPVAALAKTSVEGPESARLIDKYHAAKKLTEVTKAAEVPARDDVVLTDLILDQDFETSMSGWWTLNADGNTATYGSNDWSNWRWLALTDSDDNNLAHGGEGALYSVSWWGSAFDQDNWVITPELTLNTTGYCLSYYASSLDASYPDHLQVLVGESGTAYDSDGNIDTSAWVSL
ncbi:MAG: choice-of-anchor J domain-containing protein, partial [Clostridia bacterium]|nr:choice-of-anchor J domain-containing protein [Clostridia bacterium]